MFCGGRARLIHLNKAVLTSILVGWLAKQSLACLRMSPIEWQNLPRAQCHLNNTLNVQVSGRHAKPVNQAWVPIDQPQERYSNRRHD